MKCIRNLAIVLILAGILLPGTADAQLLKRVKDRAKDRIEKKVEEKAREGNSRRMTSRGDRMSVEVQEK